MNGLFLALALVLSADSASSFAGGTAFVKMTEIQADLRCEEVGGGLAIKFPAPAAPARVWQSDVGESDGLELELTKFQVQRGPLSFRFEATLFDIPVRGEAVSGVLNYEIYSEETKTWSSLLKDIPCKAVRP